MEIAHRQPQERPQPAVLIIGGDVPGATSLTSALSDAGYCVERVDLVSQAFTALRALAPVAVVLNLSTPGIEQVVQVTHQIRTRSSVPILVLAVGDTVEERVAALNAGADDYLARPIAVEELLARVHALVRGRELAASEAIASARRGLLGYADVRLDLDTREAWRGARRLELRNMAFELLACFVRHSERVLSRRELLSEVWGYEFLGDSNVIEVTVGHVRQALEAAGEARLIHTVRPLGYILRAAERASAVDRRRVDV
jgi:two-component system response regulator MprA